ncbi:hypothetical protein [Streptomyces spectabilis]|uniref:Uncharacterized protein n=1 Tax=Streptomyces spectabilis TaxID=68270 RepID=A0A5P2XF00_STRST|nr:hypothetical protein [Streptomyces spectabilis]MBB5108212.1 hypothetical protein [Streptomyces spectabilis]MCI3904434.1 hypothetical protein [Streptomyces spectabilis]QEV61530.1 hypothetical protein CP982_24825 [Streptomyces spectabilis]GGV27175.1 hypothetical protein GCM10010245_44680 [Streptomyces spectabilis]
MALPQNRKLALATATALALLTAGLAWQASAADGTAAESDTVSSEHVKHDPAPAGDYWTPERMRAADPAPMPVVPGDSAP